MAKPKNSRVAVDTSAATIAPDMVVGGGNAASTEAVVAASAAPAADSVAGDPGQGDTLAGGEAADTITGDDSLAASGAVRTRSMIDDEVDTALDTIGALRSLLATIDAHLDELDPNARELLRQDTLQLERFLRDRRPAEDPAPAAPVEDDAPAQPTKAQAAAAVQVPQDQVFAWRWDGEQLTVVTVAGQKLRFRP